MKKEHPTIDLECKTTKDTAQKLAITIRFVGIHQPRISNSYKINPLCFFKKIGSLLEQI